MSLLQENLHNLTQQLIHHVSGFQLESDEFKCIEKATFRKLQHVDTSFRPNRKEIDRVVRSLCDKFRFHGFPKEAGDLQRGYGALLSGTEDEIARRLSVVKLLVSLAESPTNNVQKRARVQIRKYDEEVVDWPRYLREGIPRWTPPPDVDSSESDSDVVDESVIDTVAGRPVANINHLQFVESEPIPPLTYKLSRTKLENSVQSYWFSREKCQFQPPSDDREANVTLLWDSFVQDLTKGLVPIDSSTMISEYKMLREIIWQFYKPHQSACFHFLNDKLTVKSNVTIASVRHAACESLLNEFVDYIEWVQELREFCDSLTDEHSDTYHSYAVGVQTILDPIFARLREIEDRIKSQESTFTLLSLANCLRQCFETVKLLLGIHRNITLTNGSPTLHATTLLSRLYRGLRFASSKLEQDIYLTLYLHSLYKYLTIINNWLESDILNDRRNEFLIFDENPKDARSVDYFQGSSTPGQGLRFSVREVVETDDPIVKLICTHILELGKNFHLLRLMQQRHPSAQPTELHKDSFYEMFKRKVLEKVAVYFDREFATVTPDTAEEADQPSFIFPVGCPDECKYPTEMDKLENLVDTGDGFLIKAFAAYFVKRPQEVTVCEPSLFEKVQDLTQGLFPAQNILPGAFMEILDERYSKLGVMVKNALVNDCELERHFLLLQNVFLFKDDMIFSFYHFFFHVLDSNRSWSVQTSLTSHLQDTIADAYPKLYNKATVDLKENWQLSADPVVVCQKINIQYKIEWPINIIIRDEDVQMYSYLFQFILKIKWALYTLNNLSFTELQPKKSTAPLARSTKKLVILRFGLVNIFSNIQHYILGHVFSELSLKFKRSFENAYGLESVTRAHADFIRSLHRVCHEFQERERDGYGFCLLLLLVKKLATMWRTIGNVAASEVDLCEKTYWKCHSKMEPIINPTGFCL
ncbi:gamma-tubulin complex component 5-like isoform X2 [Photinus pyralis]|nr:gamma-tubulin complex component 5-like isoform X1 [Photinus pyralis]XP_031330440.1 gamma-tubulin complex component 5-like isoform X2 [Photinus pyralis]